MKRLFIFATFFILYNALTVDAQNLLFGQSNKQVEIGELVQGRGFALADGYYCYEGVWNGDRYRAQPCVIEFNKRGNRITGTYTNEYWHSSNPLKGELRGSTLILRGTRNRKPLTITISFARGLWRLTARGTHGNTNATIPLERIY